MYLPDGSQINLCIEDDVPLLNSAVVAAATKSPCKPMDGDYRLEKISVSAPSLATEPDANAPPIGSPRSPPKEPKPHQARMSDEAGKQHRNNAGIYTDFFVEIFAGTAGLAGAVKARGNIIYTFEFKNGKSGDIMNKATNKLITELIRDKHCIGVWFGMPCATLSSARHGRDGGPGPLRDYLDVMKPNKACTPRERQRVLTANKVVQRMVEIIDHCMANNVPWYIANPRDSRLWKTPIIQELERRSGAQKSRWDYCQFGTGHMKPTVRMAWQHPFFLMPEKTGDFGQHSKWCCSNTGIRHVRLEGFDEDRKARTSKAEAYPPELCEFWARLICKTKPNDPNKDDHWYGQLMKEETILVEFHPHKR
jgi:hypothetical protein